MKTLTLPQTIVISVGFVLASVAIRWALGKPMGEAGFLTFLAAWPVVCISLWALIKWQARTVTKP